MYSKVLFKSAPCYAFENSGLQYVTTVQQGASMLICTAVSATSNNSNNTGCMPEQTLHKPMYHYVSLPISSIVSIEGIVGGAG